MEIKHWSFNLPFEFPFTISRGTKTHQSTLIVAIQHLGLTGFGEAPAIKYYDTTVEKMVADLESKKKLIEKFAFTDPERWWHFLHHMFPANPFLVCALDMAGWDLFGKMKKKPLHKIWNLDMSNAPLTDYTIGIADIDEMVRKIRSKPWPIYKVKVGTENDVQMIEMLRKNTDSILRVDANAGWSLEEAIEKVASIKQLGVELIEQPLPASEWDGMKKLLNFSPLPLIADESCASPADLEKCAGHFHGINIKLTKCGGITPAKKMIARARELGLKVMIGCMNESTIGSAAMAQLSPLVDYLDMDGPLLLKQDLATGLEYDSGKVTMAESPGLGISIIKELFEN